MRNLKKFLALVLAMTMVFSLMITVNASDFADEDDISADYASAASVLTQLGVFKGATDNKFYPKSDLSRAEFAAILYRIYTGDTEEAYVGQYKSAAAVFPDVPADAWYAGQVGFAAQKGLLIGVPGGNFEPDGKITGVAMITALLRALGYDKDGTEFTGNNWDTKALVKGTEAGIVQGVGAKYLNNGPATREMLAQAAFDSLLADVVFWQEDRDGRYEGNTQYNGGLTLGGMNFAMKEAYSNATTGQIDIRTLVNEDPYGRPLPTHAYVFDKGDNAIVVPLDGLTKIFDSEGKAIGAAATNALNVTMGGGTANTVWTDGKLGGTATAGQIRTAGGYGTKVEVWRDGTIGSYNYTVVYIHTFAATLGDNDIIPADPAAGTKRAISLDASNGDALTFETNSFSVGDTVIFTVGGRAKIGTPYAQYETSYGGITGGESANSSAGEVVNVQLAPSFTGSVTRVSENQSVGAQYAYVDGVLYYGSVATMNNPLTPETDLDPRTSTGTFYLDFYGNLIKYTGVAAAPANYVFIERLETNATGSSSFEILDTGKGEAKARVIDANTGAVRILNLAVKANTADGKYYLATATGAANTTDGSLDATTAQTKYSGKFATYTTNDNGDYVLSLVEGTSGEAVALAYATKGDLDGFVINEGEADVRLDSTAAGVSATVDMIYASSQTVLEVLNVLPANTGIAVTKTTYNGYADFPDLNATDNDLVGVMYVKNVKDPYLASRIIVVTTDQGMSSNDYAIYNGKTEEVPEGIAYFFTVNGKTEEYIVRRGSSIGTLTRHGVYLLSFTSGYLSGATEATSGSLAGVMDSTPATIGDIVDNGDYIIVLDNSSSGETHYYLAKGYAIYDATGAGQTSLKKGQTVRLYAASAALAPSSKNRIVLVVIS